MKIAILNDCTFLGHGGCILVMESLRHLCATFDMEIIYVTSGTVKNLAPHYKKFEKADLLLINGEGSLHHDRRPELLEVAAKFPAALINSVFEENKKGTEHLARFKYLAVRESLSAKALPGAHIVPDLSYAAPFWDTFRKNQPTFDIGTTDSVLRKCLSDLTFNIAPGFLVPQLSNYRRICTGRFHGVVFCSILGIPFSAYNGNTHKIRGICADMGVESRYFVDRKQALQHIPTTPPDSVLKYTMSAKGKIEQMFNALTKLV